MITSDTVGRKVKLAVSLYWARSMYCPLRQLVCQQRSIDHLICMEANQTYYSSAGDLFGCAEMACVAHLLNEML